MIPKVIHYCWFGENPLDEKALKCIESWRKFFPDYRIVQWNESNFDINQIEFMAKAYKEKKWAFVSDVARLIIIYENGGIYFDTDVELIKSFDDIINSQINAFMGVEMDGNVNSGLGFGAVKNHEFLKKHIDLYKRLDFEKYIYNLSDISCPTLTTSLLESEGYIKKDEKQVIEGVTIFPSSYFAPMDYKTGKINITKDTHSIHWYNASWQDTVTKSEQEKLRQLRALLGNSIAETIYGICSCIKKEGFIKYLSIRIKKYIIGR